MRAALLLAIACLPLRAALPDHPRLLFNAAGVEALRQRVQRPEWSAQWRSTQTTYDRNMAAAIDLPPRGSNWYHWYVCPKHAVRLSQGRSVGQWRWEHICPIDKEVFLGDPSRPQTDFDGCALSGIHDGYARAVRDGGILYQVTGDQRYLRRARDVLMAYAAKYLDYPLHDINAAAKVGGGRVGPQTLDESVWLIPMAQGADLVWSALSEADRTAIADRLFRPAARDVILPHRLGIHNIQCWKNSAVGLTGLLLDDQSLITAAIDDRDRGYRAQMAKGVQGDGVWFEGAWGYHYYTLSALWSLTEAARNSGIDLYGEPLRKMFQAPVQLSMPNLLLPAFNDSNETAVRNSLYELAYARYQDPLYLAALAGADRRNDHALWFGVDQIPPAPPSLLRSWNSTESGYAILVRGGTWLCAKYGPHGGGHGHPDKNNFILFGNGKVLFPDPGTRLYGSPLHDEWDKATVAHNTLVVDGANQAEATGKSLAFGANYSMTDAGAIYPGVRFIRTSALASESLIVFVDRVTADRERRFDLVNHYDGVWGDLPPAASTTVSYRHVEGAMTREPGPLRAGGMTIALAGNEPTEVITATGPGPNADRVPMSIFRRTGRETTYVWAVSLDGAPVTLTVAQEGSVTTVRANQSLVVVDTDKATVRTRRIRGW